MHHRKLDWGRDDCQKQPYQAIAFRRASAEVDLSLEPPPSSPVSTLRHSTWTGAQEGFDLGIQYQLWGATARVVTQRMVLHNLSQAKLQSSMVQLQTRCLVHKHALTVPSFTYMAKRRVRLPIMPADMSAARPRACRRQGGASEGLPEL